MNERLEQLRATVRELERELTELESLDGDTREVLAQAARDIHRKLDDASAHSAESLTERLQDAARRFESNHPTLAGLLERIVDGLGQLGI